MCLIAVAWRAHPRYRLAVIANRDEAHARPAAPAGPDPDFPDVHGGRDLGAGGGWLMVSTRGRMAAVTNVRVGPLPQVAPRSRGHIVRDFVGGAMPVAESIAALAPVAAAYGPFNLLQWDGAALAFAGNHPRFTMQPVAPGLHAMSNGGFDAPWPKSGHAARALSAWLDADRGDGGDPDASSLAPLFEALADATPAPDDALPDTGVGLAQERALSPPFVRGAHYGTRCSTVVLVDDAAILFAERRFGPEGVPLGESAATLRRLPAG